jgi:hypothetical protein
MNNDVASIPVVTLLTGQAALTCITLQTVTWLSLCFTILNRVDRVPGLYSALLAGAEATDGADMLDGIREVKRTGLADIDKDVTRTANFANRYFHVTLCIIETMSSLTE